MAARMSGQGGDQLKDADAQSRPAGLSRDGEAREPNKWLKFFIVVVETMKWWKLAVEEYWYQSQREMNR